MRPSWDDSTRPSLLVSAFLSHGLGQLADGFHLHLAPVLPLLLPERVAAPFPAARRAELRPLVPPLGARCGRLPAVEKRLVAGKLVQQWVTGDSPTEVSVED